MARCQFESQRGQIVRNLANVYGRANETDLASGIEWYPKAQAIVREWSAHYRYSVDTVACVTAALSPQLEWSRNLVIADDTLANRVPSINGAIHSNLRKAEKLRDTDHRTETQTVGARMLDVFPCGPKVNAFACNLSGDMSAVTVDAHTMQAALDNPLATLNLAWTPYRIFAECYSHAASNASRTPAEFQAIVWCVWKRLYPTVWKQKNRQQWSAIGEF